MVVILCLQGCASKELEIPPASAQDARKLYAQALHQDNAQAQLRLGEMYAMGHEVSQDYTKAREWYELAAKNGSSAAQLRLGEMYTMGHGVGQDNEEAERCVPSGRNARRHVSPITTCKNV